ncbi:tetratricopeptide repeat protein [Marinomonas algicola]|uniref:tetratricopeptide repeat protein n=1 Tax=Marinomonas algicola TaxID=2773454 RepID=UPI0017487416|nr:tetratricopeptide repeat protein [Marinomonas algicola]
MPFPKPRHTRQKVLAIKSRQALRRPIQPMKSVLSLTLCLFVLSGCSTFTAKNKLATRLNPIEIDLKATSIQEALVAEFSLARGDKKQAVNQYLNLAISEQNSTLAEKATLIALSLNDPTLIIHATDVWLSIDNSAANVYSIRFRTFTIQGNKDLAAKAIIQAYNASVPLDFLSKTINSFSTTPKHLKKVNDAINSLPQDILSDTETRSALIHSAYFQGNNKEAKNSALALLNDSKKNKHLLPSDIYFILGLTQKQDGQIEEAITTLEQGLAYYPDEFTLISSLIEFEMDNENFEAAKEHYTNARLSTLYKAQLSIHYVSLLIQNDLSSIALKVLDPINYEATGFAGRFYFLEANALANLGDKTEAIEKLKQVDGPLFSNAMEQIIVWLYDLNRESEVNALIASQFEQRQNANNILNVMQFHESQQHVKLAIELANMILLKQPDAADVRYKKALLEDTLGNWQQTEVDLRLLISKDPENANYLNALGYTLLIRTQHYDEAIDLISAAYELDPENPAVIDSLGWAYYLKGNLTKAELLLNEAWTLLPDAEIAAHYGETLWQQEKYDEAIIVWQHAIDSSPSHPALVETLNRLNPSMLE